MSLFTRKVETLFGSESKEDRNSEYDKLFLFLSGLINREDLVSQYFKDFASLKAKGDESFFSETIPLYRAVEDFLITSRPVVVKRQLGREELRAEIKKEIKIEVLDERFRLLFYPQDDQMVYLYEIFSQDIARYVIQNLGFEKFEKMISVPLAAKVLQSIAVVEDGFDFRAFNRAFKEKGTSFTLERITAGFKDVYSAFFNEIRSYVGNRIAASIFEKIYGTIQHLYGQEITGRFIGVVPEPALDASEWLSLLGRTELEKRVREKTRQLQELNDSLEKKILERTNELNRAVARLEELNREQDMGAKLLIRRDVELGHANEMLLELDQKKSEFVTIVAHQLRTPLSGIKWILSMLIKKEFGPLAGDQMTFIRKAYESNDRMISLVNDMLGADRIESGKVRYVFSPVQLVDLVDAVLFELLPQLSAKKLAVRFESRRATIPKVKADPEKLRDVFQNLLDNSVKYSRPKGTIEVGMRGEGAEVMVWVKDDGIGIPRDQQRNIFERFFRAQNALKLDTTGSGLGLFIVKSIILRHGGRIWFESEENKGTTFFFTLSIDKTETHPFVLKAPAIVDGL